MPQKIEPPNPAEVRWLSQNVDRLRQFAKKSADHQFSPAELDQAYVEWLTTRPDGEDPNPMINAFGAAFGGLFVERLGMSWSVVTDEKGCEMAVTGQPGDVIVFPPSFVAKRFVKKETGFFATHFRAMSEEISRLQGKAKPWWKIW